MIYDCGLLVFLSMVFVGQGYDIDWYINYHFILTSIIYFCKYNGPNKPSTLFNDGLNVTLVMIVMIPIHHNTFIVAQNEAMSPINVTGP